MGRGPTHREVTASLVRYLRLQRKAPIVVEEVAIDGRDGSEGRLDVVTVQVGAHYGHALVHGYEVKATVTDWRRDVETGKWRRYLPRLDRFYFAAPAGLIPTTELPDGVGLIVEGPNGWAHSRGARRLRDVPELPPVDLALRLLWRLHDRVRADAIDEAHRARRARLAEYAGMSDATLAAHLGGRLREVVNGEGLRRADLERRVEALTRREGRLERTQAAAAELEQTLDHAGRLLRLLAGAVDDDRGRWHHVRVEPETVRAALARVVDELDPTPVEAVS